MTIAAMAAVRCQAQMSAGGACGVDCMSSRSRRTIYPVDILSFSAGAARVTDANQAAKIRRLACQGLNVMKVVDRTAPLLGHAVFTGKVFPTATVVYDKPVGNHQEDYFTIQLSNATIASVQES